MVNFYRSTIYMYVYIYINLFSDSKNMKNVKCFTLGEK